MAINLDNVKAITHNNKEVIKIEDSNGNVIWKKAPDVIYFSNYSTSTSPATAITYKIENDTWSPQSWNYNMVKGNEIWTDGTHIYWNGANIGSKVLNETTMEWENKSWPEFQGIWSGTKVFEFKGDIYYSSGADHRIYNKTTGAWEDASTMFPGLPVSFEGDSFWTDGIFYYYTSGANKYCYYGTQWTSINWSGGIGNFSGYHTWTDGTNTYCTHNNTVYYHTPRSTRWTAITSNGPTNYNGTRTFKYNGDVYMIQNSSPYEMYKLTSSDTTQVTWTKVDFANHPTYASDIRADYFWSLDGRVTASCVSYTTK